MTKHEIIDLIANTYNLTNRAVTSSKCHYKSGENMCAVGMTLIDPQSWEDKTNCPEFGPICVNSVFTKEEFLWHTR